MATVDWYAWNDNMGDSLTARVIQPGVGVVGGPTVVAENGGPPRGVLVAASVAGNTSHLFEINLAGGFCSGCNTITLTTSACGDLTSRFFCL